MKNELRYEDFDIAEGMIKITLVIFFIFSLFMLYKIFF